MNKAIEGMNQAQRIQLASAIVLHQNHNWIVALTTDDCHQDDLARIQSEVEKKFPLNGLIMRTYRSMPESECVLNPKASWKIVSK